VLDEVSLTDMNDTLLAVEAMSTPISSEEPNLELVGYRGAEILSRLMHGQKVSAHPARIHCWD